MVLAYRRAAVATAVPVPVPVQGESSRAMVVVATRVRPAGPGCISVQDKVVPVVAADRSGSCIRSHQGRVAVVVVVVVAADRSGCYIRRHQGRMAVVATADRSAETCISPRN